MQRMGLTPWHPCRTDPWHPFRTWLLVVLFVEVKKKAGPGSGFENFAQGDGKAKPKL